MKLPCPICNMPVRALTCKKCKSTWDDDRSFYMDGYYRYYRAALSFMPKKPPEKLGQVEQAIELLHQAFRYLKESQR